MSDSAHCDAKLIVCLQPHPDLWRRAEVSAQPDCGIRGDRSLAVDNGAYAAGGTAMSRASMLMLIPIGFINSSRRISPGLIGSRSFCFEIMSHL